MVDELSQVKLVNIQDVDGEYKKKTVNRNVEK